MPAIYDFEPASRFLVQANSEAEPCPPVQSERDKIEI